MGQLEPNPGISDSTVLVLSAVSRPLRVFINALMLLDMFVLLPTIQF